MVTTLGEKSFWKSRADLRDLYVLPLHLYCLMSVSLVTLRGGDTGPNLLSLQNASRVYSHIHSNLCGFFLLRSNICACECSYVCVCVKLGQGQRSRIQQRRWYEGRKMGWEGSVMAADSPLFVHSFRRQWHGFSWFCPKAISCIGC